MMEKEKRHRKPKLEKLKKLEERRDSLQEKTRKANLELAAFRRKMQRDDEKEQVAIFATALKKARKNPKRLNAFIEELKDKPAILNNLILLYYSFKIIYNNQLGFINQQGNLEINMNSEYLSGYYKKILIDSSINKNKK